ncbi:protein-L-isoaspartate O-methyltransferase [Streptomyces inusitatus]|uniref:Protein-L-isoaspartate O-methyltransferase n=1 Tax=Streptomyces inusitatus TaxID=68221 RepID=A0A918QS46_9ACTN|nr:methyltransferase domain-containing protein [Streptomyces inusitatus]GGZ63219.1 protein-L-isoaspartate O-methyltransferase [Streptomyces inusitatus]
MAALFAERHRRLAEAMDRCGAWPGRSPWVREAMDAVPRHLFAPDRLWRPDGGAFAPVDREVDVRRWAEAVYPDPETATVTQVVAGREAAGLPCQGVVADMLDALGPKPGQRVLELGTGTGWTAALLAHRTGPDRVTSVEVDPGLASAAQKRLETAGVRVAVELGDGTAGHPRSAPYDGVIAAYAVDRIPWAWVAQTRPGGRIVTPWGRLGHVALTVAGDGRSASGWVRGLARFPPARGARPALEDFSLVRATGPECAERSWERDPGELREDRHLRFALRVALPDVRIAARADGPGEVTAQLHDGRSSWATLSVRPGQPPTALQGGPRRLADELEQAWDGWLEAGSPDLHEFGLTVESADCQYAWALDQETGPRWLLS